MRGLSGTSRLAFCFFCRGWWIREIPKIESLGSETSRNHQFRKVSDPRLSETSVETRSAWNRPENFDFYPLFTTLFRTSAGQISRELPARQPSGWPKAGTRLEKRTVKMPREFCARQPRHRPIAGTRLGRAQDKFLESFLCASLVAGPKLAPGWKNAR